MIILIALAIAIIVLASVIARKNHLYLEELESCYEEIDELNNELKNLKQELEEAYEELASR